MHVPIIGRYVWDSRSCRLPPGLDESLAGWSRGRGRSSDRRGGGSRLGPLQLELIFENGAQSNGVDRTVVARAVDKHRRRARDPEFIALAHIRVHQRFGSGGVEIGLKFRHVESQRLGVGEQAVPREISAVREESIMHFPELALLGGGNRGSGSLRGLWMHVERILLEDQTNLGGEGLQEG